MVGFKELKNLHLEDPNFGKAWKACIEPIKLDRKKWFDFIVKDGMLFKGIQLCIPNSSMKDNPIKEKHSRGLA